MTNCINRYNALFYEVPLFGGQEWKTLSIAELVSVHTDAIKDFTERFERNRNDAIQRHQNRSTLIRFIHELRGWKAPVTYTSQEIAKEMVMRLDDLADWMERNQSRAFYQDSDMSNFIAKPRAVARELERIFS